MQLIVRPMIQRSSRKLLRVDISLSNMPFYRVQSRSVRNKRVNPWSSESIRREEISIEALVAKRDALLEQIEKEEREAEKRTNRGKYHGGASAEDVDIPRYNYHFWEKVLTEQDRQDLASHDIHSMEDLFTAHQSAEASLSRYRNIEKLPPKLRFARQFYKDIPKKLHASGIAKARAAALRRP
ncbi:hypothetical protein BDQ12DRAFT_167889 [Crucibulum laeve]|uniref:Uncharacterized protein n=1 Tax=Crucibulum laeve TaxID=68775 RepID=A0A5C3ME35_9AGAR|nr:hypothetical protein BDQ12DRAFT_167889 [Crucibulum laeve]